MNVLASRTLRPIASSRSATAVLFLAALVFPSSAVAVTSLTSNSPSLSPRQEAPKLVTSTTPINSTTPQMQLQTQKGLHRAQTYSPILSEEHRKAMRDHEELWLSSDKPMAFSRNAVISTCTPGSVNDKAKNAALDSLNYLRSLNGLDPLQIPNSYSQPNGPTPAAQAAALSAAASKNATNFPDAKNGDNCVTDDAVLAASSGLIARGSGITTPAMEILRYFTEASENDSNDSLGHRLHLMNPSLANIAIGLTSIGTTGPSASSIQTFDTNYQNAGIILNPSMNQQDRSTPEFLSWPSPGFFPSTLLPIGAGEKIARWSFSAHCADLRAAQVQVEGPDGPIPVDVVHRDQPGVDAQKTPWNFAGYDTLLFKVNTEDITIPNFYDFTKYKVQITGILPASSSCTEVQSSHSYDVSLFNPKWPADPNKDFDNDGIANYEDIQPRIPNLQTARIAGKDRIQTAINIALHAFPNGAPVVYLARSDIFADALAGGALSDGPVLLTPPDSLPDSVARAVSILNPKQVIALGGSQAVGDRQLLEAGAFRHTTARLAGKDRYATALLIARRAYPTAQSLYLASASSPPDASKFEQEQVGADAVSGASLVDGPLALLNPDGSNLEEVSQLARDLQVKRVVALGGQKALQADFVRAVAKDLPAARLAGADRYETSRLIAAEAVRIHPTTKTYLARGDILADALTGGCLKDGPVILVRRESYLDLQTLHVLSIAKSYRTTILGGEKALPNSILRYVFLWPEISDDLFEE